MSENLNNSSDQVRFWISESEPVHRLRNSTWSKLQIELSQIELGFCNSVITLVLVLFVEKEDINSHLGSTEDDDYKENLNFITWMNELNIIDSSECGVELN